MASHLVILGEQEGIAWVLAERRMAFTASRAASASSSIGVGDELLLYSTRGAFHNPGKHRGRVIGNATTTSQVEALGQPVHISGREFTHHVRFELGSLAPLHQGVEFSALVPELTSFPNKRGWATSLRRPLMTLTPEDAVLIERRLAAAAAVSVDDALPGYLAQARVGLTP